MAIPEITNGNFAISISREWGISPSDFEYIVNSNQSDALGFRPFELANYCGEPIFHFQHASPQSHLPSN